MNRAPLRLILAAAMVLSASAVRAADSPWRDFDDSALRADSERVIVPQRYRAVRLDRDALLETLAQAPLEFTADAADKALSVEVALPMPDGTSVRFRVEESPIMEPGLAAQFPDIKTYRGQGLDDGTATTRFGWTSAGFHAIVLAARGTVYIDAYRRGDAEHYVSFFKRDYRRPAGDTFRCLLDAADSAFDGPDAPPALAPSGSTLRTYRLALATTVEYSDFHSTQVPPSKTDVMNNGLIPSMNRVNGVYERDVALRMVMVANNMDVIWVQEPDPYTNNNGSTMLGQNQASLDSIIGNANYDIGHVFSTGGGGVASLRVPCVTGSKARGVTGRGSPIGDPFDIDYVAHEMGHQWGGNHTFNGNAGSCAGGNRNGPTAYEVGSGSTIQAYAGICGAQDLQPNSDDYFHNISFVEIQAYSQTGGGNACDVETATGNQAPVVDAGPAFTIPSRTPFTLTASASDPDGHPLTYNWEEMDLGPAGAGTSDNGSSPILRSLNSTVSPARTFPKLSDIINNTTTYGELLPTTTRTMSFRVTVRDNRAGGGGVDWDGTSVSVIGTAGPFVVTAPNTNVTWLQGSTQTVTWDTAGTDAAPISTANVQILLSTDGGLTFPTVLSASTANDGSATVTAPAVTTTTARVKVAAIGNVFFDMSNVNFAIQPLPAALAEPVGIVVDAAGNGLLQPGETVIVAPEWRNIGAAAMVGATGALSAFTGGTLPDAAASYGTIAVGATVSCTATSNCYSVAAAGSRPTVHWDPTVLETFSPSGNTKTWTLHVGGSFTDVQSGPFHRFVETLLHRSVTGGCTATAYCPGNSTTREQMAVFVLVAKEPPGYTPVACGATPMFPDVPVASPFCRWVEELARRGVVSGCGAGNYCPAAAATREQMAIFVLRTQDPTLTPPPCGTPVFNDVPASSPFCRWIEELARRAIVSGCGGGNYCPTAAITREQMSVFITLTFGLTLYGL
jgi:reprolysin-like metallo-peptidase family M12B/S-layer family protein